MRYLLPLLFASYFAAGAALPLEDVDGEHGAGAPGIHSPIQARQLRSENEVRDGVCKDYLFFWIRGTRTPWERTSSGSESLGESTQVSNMGRQPGPQVAAYLRKTLTTRVAVQGIEYAANVMDNLCDKAHRCHPGEVAKANDQIKRYMDRCPDAKVLMGAYSQGAAMLTRILSAWLEPGYKDRILAVVTFGSTMQLETGGKIPNFPPDKVKMLCNGLDPVCRTGILAGAALPTHRGYQASALPAVQFMLSRLSLVDPAVPQEVVSHVLADYEDMGFVFHEAYRGAPEGSATPFNDAVTLAGLDGIRVASVYGRGGARVDSLGVRLEGSVSPPEHGGGGGDAQSLDLSAGEYWVEAELCSARKKGKSRIGFFRARTSRGNTMEIGSRTGDCRTFNAADGRSFVGMYGESGAEVDSVGLIEFPILLSFRYVPRQGQV
ncbi:alpha/beta-hydrolase [Colletotrichum zoysiae]|uniref:cutinase n=1 Tax=Colletotrichum zoysiae TaxID=1216348 RepID=A0AAD9M3Z6_9PEZI|nr:alpha/beta-hydrolase [Colletotrichum zoysiae]